MGASAPTIPCPHQLRTCSLVSRADRRAWRNVEQREYPPRYFEFRDRGDSDEPNRDQIFLRRIVYLGLRVASPLGSHRKEVWRCHTDGVPVLLGLRRHRPKDHLHLEGPRWIRWVQCTFARGGKTLWAYRDPSRDLAKDMPGNIGKCASVHEIRAKINAWSGREQWQFVRTCVRPSIERVPNGIFPRLPRHRPLGCPVPSSRTSWR